jgi:glycosyltransferase involved in cell wall biosynthesis
MNQKELISVIVPCYNYAVYLDELFQSLKNQKYTNWECLIIDDESKDNTAQIVKEYSEKDARIKYVFQKNAGPAAARKNGVELASGKYLQFIDADDFIGDDKFSIEIELFAANPAIDIVYSGYSFVNKELTNKWIDDKKWMTLSNKPFVDFVKYWECGLMIPIHCYLFKKECFSSMGSFDPSFKTHEDWDLNLNFSLNGFRYLHHNYIGAYYRIHSSSSSRTDLTLNRKDTLNVLAKYFSKEGLSLSYKFLIINRYFKFVADFIVEKIKYKRIHFFKVLNNNAPFWLNLYSLLVFPIYLTLKIFNKALGK